MSRYAGLILAFSLTVTSSEGVQALPEGKPHSSVETPAIIVMLGAFRVTGKRLDLRYQLRNDSKQDIWVCEDVAVNYDADSEVFLSERGQTLVIRRRMDVAAEVYWDLRPIGRYARLRAGQTRTESLSLSVPVHARHVFTSGRSTSRLEYARSLTLEIGYYSDDLPRVLREILGKADKSSDADPEEFVISDQTGNELDLIGVDLLKAHNKDLNDQNEQLRIPYSFRGLKGEHFSRITVEGLHVPFDELPPPRSPQPWEASYYGTRQTRIEVLLDLFYEGEIELEDYRGAEVILSCGDHLYNETASKIADVYRKVVTGDTPPGQLNRLLNEVADRDERDTIFSELRKKKADEERQKQARIDELFRRAKSYNSMGDSQESLAALDELLTLAPSHEEAFDLKREIAARHRGEIISNSIGMKLVWVPPGEFLMGTPSGQGGSPEERPAHEVRISRGFWMGVCEVTQVQYEAIMNKNPSHFRGDGFPVEMVSWDDAIEFCLRLSQKEGGTYRLPTEAEWEYACRAGTTTRFSWGDSEWTGLCNAENSSRDDSTSRKYDRNMKVLGKLGLPMESTVPVGSFEANAFGLYDMHGNVREWCQDSSAGGYYRRSPRLDPMGLDHGLNREVRGGSWRSDLYQSRSAYRHRETPSTKLNYVGFRVVLDGTVP
ncbi:MAG: SUMF1/EgtB/PvdO family nonheme iron enzyme [Phycisphaerae bacterium]|nr:SUMF1/EgtB/PvdO family nonheme iron enzyme [Phycisphaerae bacterium]